MSIRNLTISLGLVFTLFACASPKQEQVEPVSNDDLNAVVTEAAALRKEASKMQSDLLVFKQYSNGDRYLSRAEKGLAENYKSEYILENAQLAKTNFQKAIELSEIRQTNASNILQARLASLSAGLKDSPELLEELDDVDEDVRDETDDFSQALKPQEFAKFQKEYLSLEVKAVQFRELNPVKQAIQKSVDDDADDLAPKALNTAMLDVSDASNLIAQSPRYPTVYEESVKDAIASSLLLTEIMEVISNAEGTPENIALKIVMQNRELSKLSENVGQLEQNLEATRSDLTKKEGVLEMQNEELKNAKNILMQKEGAMEMQGAELRKTSTQIRFQNAMNEAVKQFPTDEAEVYQQGSKLIFRLKKINFRSGSSIIPAASKPFLLKVNKIITTMVGADVVVVEGHTDSVGFDDQNQVLSTNRAISVSNYLASLAGGYKIRYAGYGKTRPIASNDSAEGRAINRRVDLVVTAAK